MHPPRSFGFRLGPARWVSALPHDLSVLSTLSVAVNSGIPIVCYIPIRQHRRIPDRRRRSGTYLRRFSPGAHADAQTQDLSRRPHGKKTGDRDGPPSRRVGKRETGAAANISGGSESLIAAREYRNLLGRAASHRRPKKRGGARRRPALRYALVLARVAPSRYGLRARRRVEAREKTEPGRFSLFLRLSGYGEIPLVVLIVSDDYRSSGAEPALDAAPVLLYPNGPLARALWLPLFGIRASVAI